MFKRERIYKSFTSVFSSFEIPEVQRLKNDKAVEEIYNEENTYFLNFGEYNMPGVISIAINKRTGIQYLVDGQHRISAYKNLYDNFPSRPLNIYIDNWYYNDIDCKNLEVNIISKKINTCQPHPLTELSIDEHIVIKTIEIYFKQHYFKYIKKSNNPRSPNINIDHLKDKIKKCNIIKELGIGKGETLLEYILELNTFYSTISNKTFKNWGIQNFKDPPSEVGAIEDVPSFYLGFYKNYEWLYRIIQSKKGGGDYHNFEHKSISCRDNIPKRLALQVWKEYQDDKKDVLKGKCWCCKNKLKRDNFVCGHVISVLRGGQTHFQNLRPICTQCNTDCGIENLDDFKTKYYCQRQ